jgi:hypothetical protein
MKATEEGCGIKVFRGPSIPMCFGLLSILFHPAKIQ